MRFSLPRWRFYHMLPLSLERNTLLTDKHYALLILGWISLHSLPYSSYLTLDLFVENCTESPVLRKEETERKPGHRVFSCNIVLDSFQSVNEWIPTSKPSPGEVQDPSEFSKRFLNSCNKPILQKKYILLFLKCEFWKALNIKINSLSKCSRRQHWLVSLTQIWKVLMLLGIWIWSKSLRYDCVQFTFFPRADCACTYQIP